jgi:hypothetical protein
LLLCAFAAVNGSVSKAARKATRKKERKAGTIILFLLGNSAGAPPKILLLMRQIVKSFVLEFWRFEKAETPRWALATANSRGF